MLTFYSLFSNHCTYACLDYVARILGSNDAENNSGNLYLYLIKLLHVTISLKVDLLFLLVAFKNLLRYFSCNKTLRYLFLLCLCTISFHNVYFQIPLVSFIHNDPSFSRSFQEVPFWFDYVIFSSSYNVPVPHCSLWPLIKVVTGTTWTILYSFSIYLLLQLSVASS